jgi:TolB protein
MIRLVTKASVGGMLALAATLAVAGVAHAAFPGRNGKIAYVRAANGKNDIWTMRANGSHKRRLTRNASEPAFSPNGKKIVFTRFRRGVNRLLKGDIYTMRANGSHQQPLIHTSAGEVDPSFSPSGNKVVFTSIGRQSRGIYTIRVDGSQLRKLTSGRFTFDPTFSPNGSRIVFDRRCALKIMRADGSHERTLATPVEDDCYLDPDVSPDGEQIAFTSEDGGIWLVGIDGGGLTRVGPYVGGIHDRSPSFSPRGSRLAFSSDRGQSDGDFEINTMNLDGSNVKRLTFGARSAAVQPSWGVRPQ